MGDTINDISALGNNQPVYTLAIATRLSRIPSHSIRQYIDKGLIIPYKLDSKRHLFSEVDLIRLNYINKLLNDGGLNIAGIKTLMAHIPCWAIRKCSVKRRKTCQAYYSTTNPCWSASKKSRKCRNVDCRECKVYRSIEQYPDLKALYKDLLR